ncbi:glycosyltransferase family 4 protein [Aliarcobacter skirrowii]|uniref:glycosyltransferase family 4 protein n=1 Tax=Aliarcobacter skirrowii TaxID=28200 RepID=UPI0008254AB5|nr:glycosyltransferase family 4 protein [Aliarcobacter skirrowii]
MKKILYIVSTLKRSGPTNQLSYIIKYLDKAKYEPTVLTLSPEPKDDSMKNYFTDTLGVRIETLGLSRLKGLFFAKNLIKKFIKDNDIDLVHSQGIRADMLMSGIDMIPRIATLRNYPYYDYPMTYGKLKGNLMAKLHLNYLKKIDAPRVVSKSISKILKELNNYDIDFVRNGTDTQRFEDLDKKALREKLGIDQGIKLFVSVGHLSSRKDPITVIKAFQNAQIEYSKLIFLGDGNLHSECVSAIGEDKSIELIGKVDNVHEYLGASDYCVSASLAEGLPNTVLEAMACGLPCVLSNIPPHMEIHEINRNSSLLFDIKDVKSLNERLEEVLNKDYQIMSKASKEIVFDNLSAEIMSGNYQKVYKNLLSSC